MYIQKHEACDCLWMTELAYMLIAFLINAFQTDELHDSLEAEGWDQVAVPRDWAGYHTDQAIHHLGYQHQVDGETVPQDGSS